MMQQQPHPGASPMHQPRTPGSVGQQHMTSPSPQPFSNAGMTAPSPQYNSAAGHTPQYTPTHHNEDSIMSPASVPPAAMTPAPPVGMKSPMYQPQQPQQVQAQQQTNDLRKIRRPSKPKGEPPSPQPPPQVKEEIKP